MTPEQAIERAETLLDSGGIFCASQWPYVAEPLRVLLSAYRAQRAEILATLLSEEAVMAGARAIDPWPFGIVANITHTEAAASGREKASAKARAALTAAIATLEKAHD